MPWGPRSRARSQTLSQLHSGSVSISTMYLRWGTVDASARSLEWSNCNMTFFKAAVEIDMGSVRMSEVRLEPYCDSRKWHWRTSWMDSTSEAARDLKTRQLRESLPWVTFSRKENFEHSTQARMDGQCSAILHPRFDGEDWRRRILLPNSAWKDSSLLSSVELSIHDSEPYIRIGMIQHSMILFADRGLSFP